MMPATETARIVFVGALVVSGAAWDVATRRIPNVVTLTGALAALLFSFLTAGTSGVFWSLLGAVAGAALFVPFFALGGLGAGDVKLLGAVGAWFGPRGALWVALLTAICGGGMALVVALGKGYLGKAVRNVGALLAVWRTAGPSAVAGLTLDDARGPRLTYAIAIAAGAGLTLWLGLA